MKFTTAVLALLASTGIVSARPEAVAGGGWGPKHLTSSCWTSSTCKATYYSITETKTKPVTITETKTVYKPETMTTEVPKVYTKTKYCECSTRIRSPDPVTNELFQTPPTSRRPKPTTRPRPKRSHTRLRKSFARRFHSRPTATPKRSRPRRSTSRPSPLRPSTRRRQRKSQASTPPNLPTRRPTPKSPRAGTRPSSRSLLRRARPRLDGLLGPLRARLGARSFLLTVDNNAMMSTKLLKYRSDGLSL